MSGMFSGGLIVSDYPKAVSIPTYDTYKGHAILKLPLGENKAGKRFDFTIGYRKAKAILEHLDELKRFIEISEAE